MKLSPTWIRDFVDLKVDNQTLAHDLAPKSRSSNIGPTLSPNLENRYDREQGTALRGPFFKGLFPPGHTGSVKTPRFHSGAAVRYRRRRKRARLSTAGQARAGGRSSLLARV